MQWRIDFTRNLIHELKTPLTSLVATSELLLDEEHDKKLMKLARYIWECANSLNNRIDELHDVVKGEVRRLNLDLKPLDELMQMLNSAASERQFIMYEALRQGADVQEIYKRTYVKPWFVEQMKELVELEEKILKCKDKKRPDNLFIQAKKDGFADRYLAKLLGISEQSIRERRAKLGINEAWDYVPVSGAENARYYYSTYNGPDR
jgi:hypothetical protein